MVETPPVEPFCGEESHQVFTQQNFSRRPVADVADQAEAKLVNAASMKRSVQQMMRLIKPEPVKEPEVKSHCSNGKEQPKTSSHSDNQADHQQDRPCGKGQSSVAEGSRGKKPKQSVAAGSGFQAEEKDEAEVAAREFADKHLGKYVPVKVRFYDTFTFKCCLDHKFDLTAEQISRGQWCDICEETWTFLVKFARKKDGAVLDTQMSSSVRLKCVRGHEFSVKPSL